MRGRLAPLLLFSAAFAGCVRFGQPAPHLRDFRLAYPPPPPIGGAPLPATIRVSSLRVATIYDRLAIVHRENDYETIPSYYDRWSANPGSLVADLLARDLVDSGLYRAVERGPTLVPADYQLSGEILEIEERHTGSGCEAFLQLRMVLTRTRVAGGDPVLLQASYTQSEPSPCHDPSALAAAMSTALERISAALQPQVYAAVAKQQQATAAQ